MSPSSSVQEERKPSRAQVRANRRNARRSTGPRTIAGKRKASLNALTHGVFCKDLVMPGESQAEFDQFAAQLLSELKPQGWVELSVCEQFVEAKWRIRRVRRAEHVGLAAFDDCQNGSLRRVVRDMPGYTLPGASAPLSPDAIPRAGAADFLFDNARRSSGGVCERWGRMQQRLELSADRALRQLRQLRKDAGVDPGALKTCPFVDEDAEDDERDAPHDDHRGGDAGVVTSVTMSARGASPRDASAQNEPNRAKTDTGDGAGDGCARGSRTIEVVTPTELAPRGAGHASDDGKERRDRT